MISTSPYGDNSALRSLSYAGRQSNRLAGAPQKASWIRHLAQLFLLMTLCGCYVPKYYNEGLPEGLANTLPAEFFAQAEYVLVIPCWGGRTLQQSCGPPAIAPAADLVDLSVHIQPRRGIAVIDVFGHEGAYHAQIFQDLLIIGDNGSIASIGYAASGWQVPNFAAVGPRIRSILLAYLRKEDVDLSETDELAAWRVGRIEGSRRHREAAEEFLKHLDAAGDDQWFQLEQLNVTEGATSTGPPSRHERNK